MDENGDHSLACPCRPASAPMDGSRTPVARPRPHGTSSFLVSPLSFFLRNTFGSRQVFVFVFECAFSRVFAVHRTERHPGRAGRRKIADLLTDFLVIVVITVLIGLIVLYRCAG